MRLINKMFGVAAIVAALATVSVGCGRGTNGENGQSAKPKVPATADSRKAATGANEFGLRLFEQLSALNTDKNFVMSGASAAVALAMYGEGLGGDSRDVLWKELGFPKGADGALAKAYGDLSKSLNGGGPSTISMINAMFKRPGVPFEKSYLEAVRGPFGAEIQERDFSNKPAVLKEVNAWASENTKGKIPTILDDYSEFATFILLNALYFKGEWKEKFEKANTRPLPFNPETGEPFNVPMMHERIRFGMTYDETMGAVRLPYKGEAQSMVLIAPNGEKKLADVKAALTAAKWGELWKDLGRLSHEPKSIYLPRFKLGSTHDLNDPLLKMGLQAAIEMGKVDMSRLVEGRDASAGYGVEVVQRAIIEVDEAGTTAAAVTAVADMAKSAPSMFYPNFNRPFLFAIVDHDSGAVLFLGQVVDPRKE